MGIEITHMAMINLYLERYLAKGWVSLSLGEEIQNIERLCADL